MIGKAVALVVTLLVAGFAGCISLPDDATLAGASVLPLPEGADVRSYLRDLSEPIPGVTVLGGILEQVRIPGPDGFLLDTWIVRPDVEGPVPLVLEVTPYYGGGPIVIPELERHSLGRLGETLVPRGYAVGISSVRGTGNSEGCFTIGGPSESKDTAAVIEHLAAQPWSNGNVGLIGVSYPGTTPQDVWVEAPPALKTIVPISGISDLYKYNFVNGVPINIQGFGFNTYYWAMVGLSPAGLSGGAQALDPFSVPGAVVGEACTDQVDVQRGGVESTLTGDKHAYWQARDFLKKLQASPDKDRASVFYIHGLQDWNVKPDHMDGWLEAVQATGVPYKVWLGQWGHAWPDRDDWWDEVLVAWFDQFLKGVDTGILDAPAVQVEDDSGVWRHEHVWPPTDVEWLAFHPTPGGMLAVEAKGGTVRYHDHNGGIAPSYGEVPWGEWVAVFVSEPFEEALQLSGKPRFEGTVTADGRRASLILTLAERTADGRDRSINFAALSLNHAESLERGRPDIGGLAQQVSVDFFPQDDVIGAGSRLVLMASGNTIGRPGPSLQPVSDGGFITLTLDDAVLRLPIDRTVVAEVPQPE